MPETGGFQAARKALHCLSWRIYHKNRHTVNPLSRMAAHIRDPQTNTRTARKHSLTDYPQRTARTKHARKQYGTAGRHTLPYSPENSGRIRVLAK